MNGRSAIMIFFLVLLFAGSTLAASKEVTMIRDIQKEKGPVSFTHKAHAEKFLIGCPLCHHNDSQGKERKCAGCHAQVTEGKRLNLKEAFHQQCRGCHQKKHGPVKCADCHKK